jgi:hypothetical protein
MRSAVAVIVDKKGGSRVVITQRWRMMLHLDPGERLFVVPGLKVVEPLEWDDIPRVLGIALAYAEAWRDLPWHRYFLHRALLVLGHVQRISPTQVIK